MYEPDLTIIGRIFFFLAAVGILAIGYIIFGFFRSSDIESDHPITPEKRLVIKNNKVDTIYIYKKE